MLHVVLNNSLQKSVELNFNQPDYEFLLGSWIVGDQQVMSTICYITKRYISKTVCYSTHSLKQKTKKGRTNLHRQHFRQLLHNTAALKLKPLGGKKHTPLKQSVICVIQQRRGKHLGERQTPISLIILSTAGEQTAR